METRRYQINSSLAAPFARSGEFGFQISFGVQQPDGGSRLVNYRKCPVIKLPVSGGIIATSNFTAQTMIENFKVPTKTVRNGASRPPGDFFTDVTGETEPGDEDVDLDSLLPTE